MKLVNAGIKTAEELAQRILRGEKLFNASGAKLSFNQSWTCGPWISTEEGLDPNPMSMEWSAPETIQRLAEWHEQTDNLVPCFVWDDYDKENVHRIAMVIPQRKHHPSGKSYFETTNHDQWAYARPLTTADLFKAE